MIHQYIIIPDEELILWIRYIRGYAPGVETKTLTVTNVNLYNSTTQPSGIS